MTPPRRVALGLLALAACARHPQPSASRPPLPTPVAAVSAGEWQHTVEVPMPDGQAVHAYLWIPPQAGRLRGLVIAGMTLIEMPLAADPIVRAAAAAADLGIVFFHPHFDATFDYRRNGSDQRLLAALAALARLSGYDEIADVPWITVGHSTGGIFARNVGYWNPDRTAAVVTYKAGRIGQHVVDPATSIRGVPWLAVLGQYEEFGPGDGGTIPPGQTLQTQWMNARDQLVAMRRQDPEHLVSLLVEPGAGHFGWSQPLARHLALFLTKVSTLRIDEGTPARVRPVTARAGWLTDPDLLGRERRAPCAVPACSGSADGMWHLDRTLAEASEAFHHQRKLDGADQLLTFVVGGAAVPPQARLSLPFEPLEDGETFRVQARFLDRYPPSHPLAGAPLGHASGPIRFRLLRGAGEQTGLDTFRVRSGAFGLTRHTLRLVLLAHHPGDEHHRATEQAAELRLPERLTEGPPQTLTFAPLPDLRASAAPVKLAAHSDAGLSVRYYVARGPAVIAGNELRLTPLPPRTRFPVPVTVVAYQWGRAGRSPVQTATPVERTFAVTAP